MPHVLRRSRQRQEPDLPNVPKQNRTGEAKVYTKIGEEAKGGEKMTREELVQAALTVERWCKEHCNESAEPCDCPLAHRAVCFVEYDTIPKWWGLESFLRARGLKHDD